jgi:hypothetical protein
MVGQNDTRRPGRKDMSPHDTAAKRLDTSQKQTKLHLSLIISSVTFQIG